MKHYGYKKILLAVAAFAVVLNACVPVYKDTVRIESQNIKVSSNPTGATIMVKDENGSRIVGKTPVEFSESYSVVDRVYDKAACAMHGGAMVSDAVTYDDGYTSKGEAIAGLIGFFVGAVAGAESCRSAEGVVAVSPKTVWVRSQLPGYEPQEVSMQIPKEQSTMHFEMLPDQQTSSNLDQEAYLTEEDQPPQWNDPSSDEEQIDQNQPLVAPGPGNYAVFKIEVTGGQIDEQILTELGGYLSDQLGSLDGWLVVRDEQMRENLKSDGSTEPNACVDLTCRSEVAKSVSAEYVFDTRILKVEETCTISTSIFLSSSMKRLFATATQAACDQEGLMSAIDKIVEVLRYPPQEDEDLQEDDE